MKPRQYWRIAAALVTAFAGAVLGTAMQDLTNTTLRLTAACVVALCLTIIAVLTALVALTRDALDSQNDVIERVEGASRSVREAMHDLGGQIGFHIGWQLVSTINSNKSLDADLVVQAVQKARQEILIVDLLSSTGHRPDAAVHAEVMNGWLEILLDRAEAGITYRRICQVDDPESPFLSIDDPVFVKHCQRICEFREARRAPVILKVTPKLYPYKFVIIDRSTVVLQLHNLAKDPTGITEHRIWCEIIVQDPSGELAAVFLDMWNDMFDSEDSRTIASRHLPQNPPLSRSALLS